MRKLGKCSISVIGKIGNNSYDLKTLLNKYLREEYHYEL